MKESIKCAKTIAWNLLPCKIKKEIKSNNIDEWEDHIDKKTGEKYYLNKNTNEKTSKQPDECKNIFGLHIHTPECGTPKDGPSAGAAITLGILSQLSNIPVNNNVAMTGEIDLNGNVTKIGGVQAKLQGALRAGATKVLIPLDNKEDLDEIIREKTITEITDKKKDFTVIPVSHIFEMIPHVFVKNDIIFNNPF